MDQSGNRPRLRAVRHAGVAGFTSGEAYKVGSSYPYARLPRTFIRQTINLGGDSEKVEGAANQFGGTQSENRLVLTIGKFAVTDIFDINKYAHDPRSNFMNWALVDTGTFDYAADAWGYTYGAAVEWYQGQWTLRGGWFDLSVVPNSAELDASFGQFQWLAEIERRYDLWGHPGKIAVTGFLSRGRMGNFQDAIDLAQVTGGPANIAAVRKYQSRGGISMNVEQEITSDLGIFMRAGWANGNVEPYELSLISIAPSLPGCRSKANNGAGRTTPLASPASSTRFPVCTSNSSMTAGLASWSATACCRIPGRNRSSRLIMLSRCSLRP